MFKYLKVTTANLFHRSHLAAAGVVNVSATEKPVIAVNALKQVKNSKVTKVITLAAAGLAVLAVGDAAHAFTTPAAGSFGYNIYDIAINKVAKGPIGFVGGGWLIATAATKMNEGWVRALPYAIGGSCLIKLDELTTSLGALIH